MSEKVIQFDTRKFEAVRDMNKTQCDNELQKILCARIWMTNVVTNYNRLVQTLQDTMEKVYKASGKNK